MYGIIFTSCDFVTGCVVVYIAQVLVAIAYIIWYDSRKNPDMAGIDSAKRHLKILFGIGDSWSARKVIAALVSLGFLIFAVSVSTLLLCFRKEGQKVFTANGVCLMLAGVVFKTAVYYKANVLAWLAFKATAMKMAQLLFG